MKIAVIVTCFNRKEKTLNCLKEFNRQVCNSDIEYDIHLTDDGCTDGTGEAVKNEFPKAKIYQGGNLFWAGGMRLAWKGAYNHDRYDYFLFLNDDTFVNEKLVPDFRECHEFAGGNAIIVGNTCDPVTKERTYAGVLMTSRFPLKCKSLIPSGKPEYITFSGANIMFVPREIVDKCGFFPDIYVHSIADMDYCLRIQKKGFKVVMSPHYIGFCAADHTAKTTKDYRKMSINQRYNNLFSPKGRELRQYLFYQKSFFPWRLPIVVCKAFLNLFFALK